MSQQDEQPIDPAGHSKPTQTEAATPKRKSLGDVAKENAVIRRRGAGVGEDGLLGEDRKDVQNPAFRPGKFYSPFN
jgi:hypothetical protein